MTWYYIALLNILAGFLLLKRKQKPPSLRTAVWLVPVLDIAAGYWLVADSRPWYKMLVYIFLLFLGMKIVTALYRYPGKGRLNFIQWLAYTLGWPGMDPLPFEHLGEKKTAIQKSIPVQGLISFTAGSLLLLLIAFLLKHAVGPVYLLCLLTFVPLIMIFHAGLFNIGAFIWSLTGVPLAPLMDAPWRSDSVGSFWGKRWNIAFIQMTKITLFLPLARKRKPMAALLLSFFLSGIFHEVALTWPVGGGFGLPMLYFVIQSVVVLAERRLIHKLSPTIRIVWTYAWLFLPFPLLLHPAFIYAVMLPFLENIADWL